MKKWVLAAAAAIAFAGPASAAVVTLQSTTNNGTNNNTYTYQGTLGPDEGLRTGDRFVVYDFSGYIAGSIFTTAANFTTGTENTTAAATSLPGQVDDAHPVNLVFTYARPDIRTAAAT